MWKIDGRPQTYRTLTQAQRAAQKGFSRPLLWSAPAHGGNGRLVVVGRTGVETDDRVTIRQSR
jgi:hypothetical protein